DGLSVASLYISFGKRCQGYGKKRAEHPIHEIGEVPDFARFRASRQPVLLPENDCNLMAHSTRERTVRSCSRSRWAHLSFAPHRWIPTQSPDLLTCVRCHRSNKVSTLL